MESLDGVLPPEEIAFIAYNIGIFESVQKFGGLITSGKITEHNDVSKVAELLSQSRAFYDADMVAGRWTCNVIPQKRQNYKETIV